jgi:Nitroreductase family
MIEPFSPRVTPWHIDDSELYELESFHEQMRFLLQYAVLAPSGHNTQPWAFRVTAEGVEVFADYSKRLPVSDPQDRELLLSIGAAITNFRVAAAHFGFETTVLYEQRPEESLPVATIVARETSCPDAGLSRLFAAITQRHTNRQPFEQQPIQPETLSTILDVMDEYPDLLHLVIPREKLRVIDLIAAGDRKQMSGEAFRGELADWICNEDGSVQGIPAGSLGIPSLVSPSASWAIRRFDLGAITAPRSRTLAVTAQLLIVLASENDRTALIRAGEVLERLLLTLTLEGLDYSFLNQPIEVLELRDQLQQLAGSGSPPQLLIRVGHAVAAAEATPRRPVDAVLVR